MLKKLKRKFVFVTMGIVLVMLAVIFGMIYFFTKGNLDATSSEILQRLSQAALRLDGFDEPPRDVELPYFFVYVNQSGEYMASGYTSYDLMDEAFVREILNDVFDAERGNGTLAKYHLMYHYEKTIYADVVVFLDVSSYNATLSALVRNCLMIAAAALVLFFVLSILLARWMVRPVETAWQQQKQFVSDASHELKTPLTVIMGNAELLRSDEYDKESKQKFTDSILTMTYQMRKLVEGLLELTRVENGQVKKSFEKMDFSTLVSNAILPFEPVFFENQLKLDSSIEQGIMAVGSSQHLYQVIDILLDNAGKYSSPGFVNVTLKRQGHHCLLTVSNPGEPIPTEELEKIFQRFYRVDASRSRNGSFGLGLSIAQMIVREHGGKIWAVSNSTGNCFCVELPCV